MTTTELLRALRKRGWVIILATALCSGLATFITLSRTPQFTSTTQLFVSAQTPDGVDPNGAYAGGLFTQERVQSYVQLARSPKVTHPVIRDLGLDLSPQELADKIEASAPENTVLLDISVRDASATQARTLANRVASELIDLIGRLESPRSAHSDKAPVRVSVSSPAAVPTSASSPNKPRDIAVGVLLGVALGIALALALDRLDTTVKALEPADTDALGATPLGEVPRDRDDVRAIAEEKVLGGTARGEAIRQVRTNLRFLSVDAPPSCIMVTSPAAGDGKTTTAVALAAAFAEAGQSVILADADLRRSSMSTYLGLESQTRGITTVLLGSVSLAEALVPWDSEGHVRILQAGPPAPNPAELIASDRLKALVAELRELADVVVIDAPPVLPVADAVVLATQVDAAIIVLRHGKTRRADLHRTITALSQVNSRVIGAALNMTPPRTARYY